MKHVHVFPGQGSQFSGMGKELFVTSEAARQVFNEADAALGFKLSAIMFTGTDDELKQTRVTQPAVFVHSLAAYRAAAPAAPSMMAGHSLGELSALVAGGALSLADGLMLVSRRAEAMQKACEATPSTMAAILGLDDAVVEAICKNTAGVVVAANYNCPGQLVISGEVPAVEAACEALKAAGAKRALLLPVGGAFHSPLMMPAQLELKMAIEKCSFSKPVCPIYQNAVAMPVSDPGALRANLVAQLTAPVKWTQSISNMAADGATHYTEFGPGKVLSGLIRKIHREAVVE